MSTLPKDSLLLYKQRAARLVQTGDKKIEIKTAEGESLSVRPKDVTLLHPGPVSNLGALRPPKGEVMAAWELLAGETVGPGQIWRIWPTASSPRRGRGPCGRWWMMASISAGMWTR